MDNIKDSQTFKILNEIANMNFVKPCYNERYLHHYFTEKIQKTYPIVYNDLSKSKLHPEWATAIKDCRNGGKYKKRGNEYTIDNNNGTSGFIDFVLGDYCNPEMGIEFKCNKSWRFQSIVFDYMKLLDRENQIQKAVSFSIIFREEKLSMRLTFNEIKKTIEELSNRLNERLDTNRSFLFWIIEIDVKTNQKNSWYCTNLNEGFLKYDF